MAPVACVVIIPASITYKFKKKIETEKRAK
jgi:hypothetical protein